MMRPAITYPLFASLSFFLASCSSLPARVEWRSPVTTSFTTTATNEKTFFLDVKDIEGDRDMAEGIEEALIKKFTDKGLKPIQDPASADYICLIYLRYFNTNPHIDQGASLLEAAADVEGGLQGWWTADGTEIADPPAAKEITPMGARQGVLKDDEWDLLIDVCVGEKTGEKTTRRTMRFLGTVGGSKVSREEALWLFRRGPLPPEKLDEAGNTIPLPMPSPPDELVETLSGILPVP